MLSTDSKPASKPDRADLAEGLRRAFTNAHGRVAFMSDSERDTVREAVCAFVQARKAAGASIEATIVALKTAALEAGLEPFGERAVENAVRWCIEEFYREG